MTEGTGQPDPWQPHAVPEPALPDVPVADAGGAAEPTVPAPVGVSAQPGWPPPPIGAAAPPAWPPPPAGSPPPAGASAQPAWPPPPASATAPWPPAAAAGPTTSVLVVVAGIFLLLAGILTFLLGTIFGLLGGLLAVVGTAEEGLGVFGPLGGMVAGFSFLVVFWGLLEVVAAIGMFIHRGWGRALGLIVGVVGLLFAALAVLANVTTADAQAGGVGFSLVLLAGYGLTVLALVTGAEHFRRRA